MFEQMKSSKLLNFNCCISKLHNSYFVYFVVPILPPLVDLGAIFDFRDFQKNAFGATVSAETIPNVEYPVRGWASLARPAKR